MTVAFIGPSLPPLTGDDDIPQEIRDYSESTGYGVALFKSPQDQSTCAHLTADIMIKESGVVDNRCRFYETFSGSNSFVLLDQTLKVEEVRCSVCRKFTHQPALELTLLIIRNRTGRYL
jgi:hypothetical protein